MKKFSLLIIALTFFLTACNNADSVEETFEHKMQVTDGEYEIITVTEESQQTFVVYNAIMEESDSFHIAYLEKDEEGWTQSVTSVCNDEWSGTLTTEDGPYYFYCGLVTEPMVKEVLVGGEQAETVKLENQNWLWYSHIRSEPSTKIKAVMTNGTEELLKEI